MKKSTSEAAKKVAPAKKVAAKKTVKAAAPKAAKPSGKTPKAEVDRQPEASASGGGSSATTLARIPLNRVSVCPLNPRKKVDPAGIDEMARSILAHGIIQPPVARHVRGEYYEVVFGQRRLCGLLRAREMARAEKLPEPPYEIDLLIREMDDNTVREEAWVENLQRVDVSVREEAEGFADLLDLRDETGRRYTLASLAEKLGKEPSFISRRLKLKGVPECLWTALEAGDLGVRQMELVGQLPTMEMREKAAKEVLTPRFRVAPPLTVKETIDLIKTDFMVSLRGVEWSMKDADLVPAELDAEGNRLKGGDCQTCPFRTGSNADLQDSLSDRTGNRGWDKNSCMLPACHALKKAACWKREKGVAQEAGMRVLTDQEAEKTFSQWGSDNEVDRSSGMVVLSSKPTYNEVGHHAQETLLPWADMIGDKLPTEELVLARNPKTGSICRLLPLKLAIELAEEGLKEQGKESPFAKAKKEKSESGPKERAEHEIARLVRERAEKEVMAWLRKQGEDGALFGAMAQEELAVAMAAEALQYQGAGDVCEALGIPVPESTDRDTEELEKKLEAEVRASAKRGQPWWLLSELFCALNGNLGYSIYRDGEGEHLERFLEAIGVPLEAIVTTAKAEVEAEEKDRLEAAQEKKSGKKAKAA